TEQHQNQAPLPDLIIVDLYMPLMNGWFFLKEYRQISRNQEKESTLLITSCTSYDRDFQQMREFKEVSGYIAKPFTLEKISSIASRYLGSR
ncbi:MAG: response regulator, partial [Bacteroidota bacterium]